MTQQTNGGNGADGESQEGFEWSANLKELLEDLTAMYSHDNRKVTVEHTNGTPHIDQKNDIIRVNTDVSETIGRNLEGTQALRVVLDTLSHEVAHKNYTPLDIKSDMADRYPEWATVAAHVANILEDQYIDQQRLGESPGLRGGHAFKIDKIMENHHRRPPMDSSRLGDVQVFVEGLTQVAFAGYAKNIGDAPGDVQQFLAWVRPKVKAVRTTHDGDERTELIAEVIERLITYLPDTPAAKQEANEYAKQDDRSETDDAPNPQPAGDEGDEGDEGDDEGAGDGGDGGDDDEGDEQGAGGSDGSGSGSKSQEGDGVDVNDLLNGNKAEECKVVIE